MRISGDPYADFDAHDREREERRSRAPKCHECGEPIQSEKCYYIDGRYFICLDCIAEVYTEEYEQ